MKVSFFIDRPVFSAVISILIVIVGIIGLTMLPIDRKSLRRWSKSAPLIRVQAP